MKFLVLIRVLLLFPFVFRIQCQDEDDNSYTEIIYYDDDEFYDESELKILCGEYDDIGFYPSPRGIQYYLYCGEDLKSSYEYKCNNDKPIFFENACVKGNDLNEFCKDREKNAYYPNSRGINYYIFCDEDIKSSYEEKCPEEKPIFDNEACAPSYNTNQLCKDHPKGFFYPSPRGINFYLYCDEEEDGSFEGRCPEDNPIFAGDMCTPMPNTLTSTSLTTVATTKHTETTPIVRTTISTKIPTITTPKVKIVSCPSHEDPSKIIFIPSKENCSEYFVCYHGNAIPMFCGDSLYFNPKIDKCDFPKNVDCEIDNEHIQPRCKSETGYEYYNHPEKCYFFYYCHNGRISLQRCPFMHSWDLKTKQCIRAHLSDCHDKKK